MSPQTAQSWDGLWGVGNGWWAIRAFVNVVRLVDPGELDAELGALAVKHFRIAILGGFGLSLLEVDSDRCSGSEARRWPLVATCSSDIVGNVGREYLSCAGAG